MPWTSVDADRFKKGLSDSQKKQWASVANSALQSCMKKGGSEKECAGQAIRIANGVTGNEWMETYRKKQESYEARTEILNGRNHLVVPVVMMVEGVHEGSHGKLFHPSEELGKFPASWNGIPIVIQHPQKDGIFISANSPEVTNTHIGKTFNTGMDGGKLKAEAWLDEEKLMEVNDEVLSYIQQGEALEVSAGVFTDEDGEEGEWNGERYEAIARNHRPDHLALLPDGQGACSLDDGCGVRVNSQSDMELQEMFPTVFGGSGSGNFGHEGRPGEVGGSGDGSGSGGESSIKDISNEEFAKLKESKVYKNTYLAYIRSRKMPNDESEKKKLEREAHLVAIKKAWEESKVKNNSITDNFEPPESGNAPAGVKKILKEVYDSCRARWVKDHSADKENSSNKESCSRIAWSAVKKAGFTKQGDQWIQTNESVSVLEKIKKFINTLGGEGSGHFGHAGIPGHLGGSAAGGGGVRSAQEVDSVGGVELNDDVRDIIDRAVKVKGVPGAGNKSEYFKDIVEAIQDDRSGREWFDNEYSVEGKNEFNLRQELEEALSTNQKLTRTKFGTLNKEVNKMSDQKKAPCCEDVVNELITNERTKFKTEDKEWLMTLEEGQLQKLIPEKVNPPTPQVTSEQIMTALKAMKPEDKIKFLSDEDQAALDYGKKQLKANREKMIKTIQDNAGKELWPDAKLTAMDEDILERVFNSVRKEEDIADYSANVAGERGSTDDDMILMPAGVQAKEEPKK